MKPQRGFLLSKLSILLAVLGIVCVSTTTPGPSLSPQAAAPSAWEVAAPKGNARKQTARIRCIEPQKLDRKSRALTLILALQDPRALALACQPTAGS